MRRNGGLIHPKAGRNVLGEPLSVERNGCGSTGRYGPSPANQTAILRNEPKCWKGVVCCNRLEIRWLCERDASFANAVNAKTNPNDPSIRLQLPPPQGRAKRPAEPSPLASHRRRLARDGLPHLAEPGCFFTKRTQMSNGCNNHTHNRLRRKCHFRKTTERTQILRKSEKRKAEGERWNAKGRN
jgi:hypothetical protein